MKKMFNYLLLCSVSLLLFISELSTSGASLGAWYEPECPKELWK